MIGITSFGAYLPRLRLERNAIFQAMGWLSPALMLVAQGERSMCNWDEDALTMSVAAARDALQGLDRQSLDGVLLASTTLPFADRQNAGIVATALNLRSDILTADYTASQKAATTALITALESIQSGQRQRILVIGADRRKTKPASFYEMWFGDGAAAVTVGDHNVIAEFKGAYSVAHDFVDHYRGSFKQHDYVWEERWARDVGYARIIPEAVNGLMQRLGITIDQVDKLVFPCIFRSAHRKIAQKLGATSDQTIDTLHEVCGETGTGHVLMMLAGVLEDAQPGERLLVAGFGQGCNALYFEVTDQILNRPQNIALSGALARKKTINDYPKWLSFRGQIEPEQGIRAEAPSQTAMTVLWRKRQMLLGLMGGRCRECGTPQFPKTQICVNPACGAFETQEDHPFADTPARIKTFTGDMLAVSVDPPHTYGMVQFEGGGRMLADFTDCDFEKLAVGQSVEMVFRRRITDRERGFRHYFWKAVPQPTDLEGLGRLRFDNRVAIVTGAGTGLGRVYALELAKRGAKVIVNDFGGAADGSGPGSSERADRVVGEIQSFGGEAVANYDSVATPEGGGKIVDTALQTYGRVDILINNAGILQDKSFANMDPTTWHAVIAVHLDGAYHVTHSALSAMQKHGYGRIVMTTSAAGLYGNFGQTNYAAAKMGLLGFAQTVKQEVRKYNIRINTVAPVAASRLTADILPQEILSQATPEQVASLVLMLCSESCQTSGDVFNCGMGYFSRAAIITGSGIQLGDLKTPPTPEQIHAEWARINSLENGQEYDSAQDAIMALIAPAEPAIPPPDDAPGSASTVAEIFAKMPGAFNAAAAQDIRAIFQYQITGPGGGDWYCTVANEACTVTSGTHDQPLCTLTMAAEDFVALAEGRLSAMQAFTSGKLKITGDIMKSQLIEKLFRFPI